MRASFRAGFLCLLLVPACAPARDRAAEPAPVATRPASPAAGSASAAPRAEAVARLAADVAWLADDARQGRRAGTEEARAAGEWLAARCAELGLAPAGTRGFLQEFEVPLPARAGETSLLRVATESGSRMVGEWKGLVPLFCSEAGTVEGPLVFRGYGIESLDQRWDDFGGERLDGAIVVLLRGVPPASELLPADPAPADGARVEHAAGFDGSIFQKVMNAKRHGAAGVILLQEEGADAALPFDASQPARAKIPAVSATRAVLAELVGTDTARELCARAARRDRGAFGALPEPLRVRLVADVRREKGKAYNVLARLPGGDRARTVVVGAHYDHLGLGGEGSLAADRAGEIHNGADDNASGTAAVLEIARTLAAGPQPAGDVVFALWSGEELGLLGSQHWCENPTLALADVRANLNLDMVGRARAPGDAAAQPALTVLGAGTALELEGFLEPAGRNAGLKLLVNRSGHGIGGSDHMSFMNRKVPVLHLFTGLHPDYHKPTDDSDKVDAESIARIAGLCVELVGRIQGAPSLAWNEEQPETKEPAARRPAAAVGGFKTRFGSVPDYAYEGPGMRLAGTSADSPAQKAGMLAGDILLQVGEVRIDTIHDFVYALGLYKPGDVVVTRFARGAETEEVRITLEGREAQ